MLSGNEKYTGFLCLTVQNVNLLESVTEDGEGGRLRLMYSYNRLMQAPICRFYDCVKQRGQVEA